MTTFQTGESANGQAGNGPHLGERVDNIGSNAHQIWEDARGAVDDLTRTLDLKGRVQRNPYGTLAMAAGVGYILGGGLFTPLTARILRLGVRLAALPLVTDELTSMAENLVGGMEKKL